MKWFATEGGVSALRDSITTPTMVSEYTAPRPLPLLSNHPNPFNPSTTITFTLPSSGRATLTVYSLTGQKVRGLLSGNLGAGAHSVVWDGKDDGGRTLSSGVYIALLRMGSTASSIKMTLEK